MTDLPSHLASLEAEAIHIIREGVAEARNPVLLFSGGKDSTVLAHLLLRAFFPAPPPVPRQQPAAAYPQPLVRPDGEPIGDPYGLSPAPSQP